MSFHDIRLPARLAFGSTGGVERRTEVVQLANGFEQRNSPWAHGRRRWLIGAAIKSLAEAAELTAFFEARRGRLFAFRFRDFADWRSAPASLPITPLDQAIGTGDGETAAFQLCKTYGAGEGAYTRPIAKPVADSVTVAVDGAPLDHSDFSLDPASGVATLATAPGEGAVVSAGFAFDVPVRFDADRLDITLEGFDAGRVVAVPLVEVRV